ncbi:DUF4179 domain-containing protein [Metasolibacillus fluoroglycofenilyticus]|uniref:DUF4179 domain-containing protein n=1 Tax=Metasolibacillus fluoroglycofenilyticus TaxID=1239396 RepID=UPI000D3BEEBD|nr:DUF4179 domain-containing protein [Metasolibacillus fluoroglycofenilyticus]
MENNIKKAIDEMEVPMQKLDEAISKGIVVSKKKPRNILAMGVLTSVAAILLVLGAGFVSPTVGNALAKVPFMSFVYKIEEQDKGLHKALSDNNAIQLNKTVTSNGISVTFEEIVYDGARINVIYSMPEYQEIGKMEMFVNGEWLNTGGSITSLHEEDGSYRALYGFRFDEDLPDAFDLTLKIDMIAGVVGDWTFETPIKKVKNNHRILQAGQTGMMNGIAFEVKSAQTSTTSTKLQVEFTGEIREKVGYPIGLSISETITDQNGVPLKILEKSGEGRTDYDLTWTYILEPLAPDVTELRLYYYSGPKIDEVVEDIIVPLSNELPQKIDLGAMGDIVITNVEQDGNEATLRFLIDSDFPFDGDLRTHPFAVVLENGERIVTDVVQAVGRNEYQLKYKVNVGQPFIKTRPLTMMAIEPEAQVVISIK